MLTIAGFDPSSGAGVTADLAVFAAEGFFGTACVTALTVQSTVGVRSVEAVKRRIVEETLVCLWEDLPADGIKIGMMANAANVEAIADFLQAVRSARGGIPFVVVDPVLRSSSGRELLSRKGIESLKQRLLPMADWVTPNLDELGVLTGLSVRTPRDAERGAVALRELYPGLGVVVTGGHLEQADDLVVLPDGSMEWMCGARIASRSTHGTGCAFSSSMACGLAQGMSGSEAARHAKTFVAEAIRRAEPLGKGQGPMDLRWYARH